MKVLLIDVDSKISNLALMQLSAMHKSRGDKTFLNRCPNPDLIYASCIFTKNRQKALNVGALFGEKTVIGGSGVDLSSVLPDEAQHIMPDYSLYNGCDYSLGFTSRGCHRRCPFCFVPEKEGYIREYSPFDEFVNPKFDKIMLLDNNFLASPKWREKLYWLINHKFLKVCFTQGLDIRLINDDNAKLLYHLNYRDIRFKKKRLYFAWDNLKDEQEVKDGITTLAYSRIPRSHLMFYMLCGFCKKEEYDFTENYYRFTELNSLGVLPFVMIYNNRRDIPILRHFARWVNKRYYKVTPFHEYKRLKPVEKHLVASLIRRR